VAVKKMNDSCSTLADLLVDYADGELSSAQAATVEDHLAQCPACRASLQRLERSLDLARAAWQESAELPASPRRPLRRSGALMACAAALLMVAGLFYFSREPRPRLAESAPETTAEAVENVDFERLLTQEVRAARLAVSANLLAGHVPASSYERGALAYLAGAYPETEPGRQAARQANLSREQ
jgi:anti-sigma factor RsiW